MAGLEAKLIISAEDRTAAAFASLMARMDRIFAKAKEIDVAERSAGRAMAATETAIGRAGPAMAASAASMEAAAHSLERAAVAIGRSARATQEASAAMAGASRTAQRAGAAGAAGGIIMPPPVPRGPHGRGGRHGLGPHAATTLVSPHGARTALATGGYNAGGFGGAVAAVVAGDAAIKVVEAGSERQHERVRMDIAGLTLEERQEAEKRAAYLTAKYPQIKQTDAMHMLRNVRGVTGSYAEASDMADDILRTRIVAQAAKPGRDVEGDFDKLIKGLEEFGVTQHPKEFHEAMRRVQKVLAVEGDTLTADGIYQSFKYTRQALPGTSQRFMLGTAPALAQAMGGSSFGNALSSFNQAVVQGRMSKRSLGLAMDLGLIDKDDVNLDKQGKPTSVKTSLEGGHGFKDWKTAKSDPDFYIWNTLDKALKARGITDPDQVMQITSTLFGNRMAGDLVGKILTQKERILKNHENLARAPDDPAERIMKDDPMAGWQGFTNSLSNIAAALLPAGGKLATALDSVTASINDKAAALQGVKTDHAQRVENQARYGLDTPKDLTQVAPPELAAQLRGQLLQDKLKLKGLLDAIEQDRKEHAGGFLQRLGVADGGPAMGDLVGKAHELRAEIKLIEDSIARLGHLGEMAKPTALGVPPPAAGGATLMTPPPRDPVERMKAFGVPGAAPGTKPERLKVVEAAEIHLRTFGKMPPGVVSPPPPKPADSLAQPTAEPPPKPATPPPRPRWMSAAARAERERLAAIRDAAEHAQTFSNLPPTFVDPNEEHERIVRAATGGAGLASPFGGGGGGGQAGGGHVDLGGTLTGEIQGRLDAEIRVTASPELQATISSAKQIIAKGNVSAQVAGGGAPTGNSMPEANPTGRSGGGR